MGQHPASSTRHQQHKKKKGRKNDTGTTEKLKRQVQDTKMKNYRLQHKVTELIEDTSAI